ncbi:nuclear transport factor 2 family protein [Photobacterium phosphoreum]|uniref:nuclear transport factor 2 family protein n=1 Tax=Photobacterium phosphoreum TaxID=659 RepID=UPI0005D4670A|nr:nuclear transport factor 2 family protein [Photobacterium phosphoreum]KJF85818.1 hypothetical protein UB41_13810 [Photobacterium phosphoreum]PQJ91729.1 hypothetical protein BTO21_08465 [Photobacterium phosphoreum]PSV67099.1 hypothetical protein CTM77_19020 [Photobacterium phosphoreum]
MLNILIPMAGENTFKLTKDNNFPKLLSEIDGRLLIEHAAAPFLSLKFDKKIIVAVPTKQAEQYQLDKVIHLLGDDIAISLINGHTKGSVCSALLAIDNIDLDKPLVISSFEQVLDFDLNPYLSELLDGNVDAGVLTFEAIHPKWSYVKVDNNNTVTQAAEKTPISNNAIAGLYFYKSARIFIDAAKEMIRKDVQINDSFFISPTINEIILNEGIVKAIKIDKSKYFHINDEHSLETFDIKCSDNRKFNRNQVIEKSKQYIADFNLCNIDKMKKYFSEEISLIDPNTSISGKKNVLDYIETLFTNVSHLSFKENNIMVDTMHSIIEFELKIDNKKFIGTDIIEWNDQFEIQSICAYLYEVYSE